MTYIRCCHCQRAIHWSDANSRWVHTKGVFITNKPDFMFSWCEDFKPPEPEEGKHKIGPNNRRKYHV